MASTFVDVNVATRLGQKLRRLVDLTRETTQLFDQIKAIMDTQIDVTDYTVVESQFGLAAGKGQTAYNLVTAARTKVKDAATTAMIDQLG